MGHDVAPIRAEGGEELRRRRLRALEALRALLMYRPGVLRALWALQGARIA